jgi:chromatin remodeling complex protein RSC6
MSFLGFQLDLPPPASVYVPPPLTSFTLREQIYHEIQNQLHTPEGLNGLSRKQLRARLEAHFGVSLAERTQEIKMCIESIVASLLQPPPMVNYPMQQMPLHMSMHIQSSDQHLHLGKREKALPKPKKPSKSSKKRRLEGDGSELEVKKKRKLPAGFLPWYHPSETLGDIIGTDPVTRPQTVKKIWQYIKANNLQDEKDKRQITCDTKLQLLFNGEPSVNCFGMNKYFSDHLTKVSPEENAKLAAAAQALADSEVVEEEAPPS